MQVIDASEIRGLDEFAELLDSGIVKKSVGDHEDQALFFGKLAELFAMCDFQSERLFDNYVTARFEREVREFVVAGSGSGNDDGIGVVAVQGFRDVLHERDLGKAGGRAAQLLIASVTDEREACVRQIIQCAGVVRAPVAIAN